MERTPPPPHKPHILFLFSDTGGGHRSASEAVIEALGLEFGDCLTTEMVDFLKNYAPPPLDKAPEIYPSFARVPDVWEMGYHLIDGPQRTRVITGALWPYYRRASRKLVREHPADLIVSVHPLANTPILRALGQKRPPFLTVVTDLLSTHSLWYDAAADRVIVPTAVARQRALENGVAPAKVEVIGLPVAERFCAPAGDRASLRQQLGWPEDRPVILVVGGGEGMGPVAKVAFAVDAAGLDAALVVVAGRNRKLKTTLDNHAWQGTVQVHGFVREMPDFMRAADILVTKAGPGTISEAFIAGLPIVLYDRMPGQEDGNVTYVTHEGAGVWAPKPDQVVDALRYWLKHPAQLSRVSAACRRLARPDASRRIARSIGEMLGLVSLPEAEASREF
ncbi:MAG TPA: glycosyltransferase [Anaerolineaceae bacterium]